MLKKENYTKHEVERIIEFTEIKCNQRYKYYRLFLQQYLNL